MSKDNPSIEDLLINDKKTEEPQDILTDKIKEIRTKDKEKETAEHASVLGMSYINLTGFAITPEALILIPQTQAAEEKIICFYY